MPERLWQAEMIVARHFETGDWIEIAIDGGSIRAVRSIAAPSDSEYPDLWVAPAFLDIQTNGRWGHSFSAPDLTVERVVEVVRAHRPLGTARLCPTLITAPVEHF